MAPKPIVITNSFKLGDGVFVFAYHDNFDGDKYLNVQDNLIGVASYLHKYYPSGFSVPLFFNSETLVFEINFGKNFKLKNELNVLNLIID
jgi:hypothetical protein